MPWSGGFLLNLLDKGTPSYNIWRLIIIVFTWSSNSMLKWPEKPLLVLIGYMEKWTVLKFVPSGSLVFKAFSVRSFGNLAHLIPCSTLFYFYFFLLSFFPRMVLKELSESTHFKANVCLKPVLASFYLIFSQCFALCVGSCLGCIHVISELISCDRWYLSDKMVTPYEAF
jgi:hypothetical protein